MPDLAGIQSMVGVTVIESTGLGVRTDGVDGDAWSALVEPSGGPVRSSWRVGDHGEICTELRRMEDAADNATSESPAVRARVRQIARQYGWILTVAYPDDIEILAIRKRKHADSAFDLLTAGDDGEYVVYCDDDGRTKRRLQWE